MSRAPHDDRPQPGRTSAWFGAALVLLFVGFALVAVFWFAAEGTDRPGKVLAAGIVATVGALALALWSANTIRQRRIARWLVVGIATATAIGFVIVLIQLLVAMEAYDTGR